MLVIRHLTIRIKKDEGKFFPVKDVSLEINENEIVGLVGESGSGKTMLAYAVMGVLPPGAEIAYGEIRFNQHILYPPSPEMPGFRGNEIAIIFQNPASALNPLFKIGVQISDIIQTHQKISRHAARLRILELFSQVGFTNPEEIYHSYPHQLSGGMAQRVFIVLALSCRPRLLIADEPTTALDITTQNRVLKLIRKLQEIHRFGLLLITHDSRIVKTLADKIAILKDGILIEYGGKDEVFKNSQNLYTREITGHHLKNTETESSILKPLEVL